MDKLGKKAKIEEVLHLPKVLASQGRRRTTVKQSLLPQTRPFLKLALPCQSLSVPIPKAPWANKNNMRLV